ncbi:hypothetical protein HPB51_009925 [Rhipicephalus microplus]|uniref:Uncharacterized protein n=1 Tax=Rhipicephalus microplus TaxID=6941 RepID=A0A9J6ESW8_RHIMP|nr:hypothetical protein HPB51_009925 [Rhipicephalus microplus]
MQTKGEKEIQRRLRPRAGISGAVLASCDAVATCVDAHKNFSDKGLLVRTGSVPRSSPPFYSRCSRPPPLASSGATVATAVVLVPSVVVLATLAATALVSEALLLLLQLLSQPLQLFQCAARPMATVREAPPFFPGARLVVSPAVASVYSLGPASATVEDSVSVVSEAVLDTASPLLVPPSPLLVPPSL